VLLVRLGALVTVATLMVLLIVVVGALAPIALNVTSKPLPAVLPPIDIGALVIFILGLGLASYAVIAFATLATVLVRHGALTLVSVLVYVVVEGAILALLTRFKEFSFDFLTGTPGPLQWTLDFLPAHGFVTMMDVGARAARGPVTIPGFEMPPPPPISDAYVAMFGFVAWGTLFALLALWRFRRMDIVE
jgi:hypothetical protein